MVNFLIKYQANLICFIGILSVLSFFMFAYSGVKEGYFEIFLLAGILAPMIVVMKTKNNFSIDFGFAVVLVLVILYYAIIFWEYQDRPPAYVIDIDKVSEESRGGWFSFENPLRIDLFLICSTISLLISSLIRVVYTKLKLLNHNSNL